MLVFIIAKTRFEVQQSSRTGECLLGGGELRHGLSLTESSLGAKLSVFLSIKSLNLSILAVEYLQ